MHQHEYKVPMYQPIVTVQWTPADLKIIRPYWSDERIVDELHIIKNILQDRLIELGWDMLDSLVPS